MISFSIDKSGPAGSRRPGSMYVAVLGTTMLVMVIGLSALTALRIERRSAEQTSDFAQARFVARSAVEMGFLRIDANADWRNTYPNGVWESNRPIGNGTYDLAGVDPVDGDFTNNDTDPLVLTGTGAERDARYKLEVTLVADSPPLGCLQSVAHAGNDVLLLDATATGTGTISANNIVQTTGQCAVYPGVEAVNAIAGSGYYGTTTTGIAPRSMPDTTVFDYYLANGTWISMADIPSGQIENTLLSPAVNPYGAATNPQGIYVIDCMSMNVVIRQCRIVGTLVLLEPGSGSKIAASVNLSAAATNYPSLLVRGDIEIQMGPSPLDESAAGVNLNPVGTPYEGVSDNDTIDSYPSQIAGLAYVSGALNVTADVVFDGVVVVGGTMTATNALTLTYQSAFFDNPPPGFTDIPRMVISPGSWKQVLY